MPLNQCAPCDSQCLEGFSQHEPTFRRTVLTILCQMLTVTRPEASSITRINGNYNGTNQSVLAAPGAGYKYLIRSLYVGVEDSNTDVRFGSADSTADPLSPNFDYVSNGGAMAGDNPLGWMETDENEAFVVTSNNPVDLLGVAIKVPV